MEGKKSYQSSSYILQGKKTPKHKPRNYCFILKLLNHIPLFISAMTKTSSQATSTKSRVNVKTCLCRETARMLDRLSGIHLIYTYTGRPSRVSSAHPLNCFCDLVKRDNTLQRLTYPANLGTCLEMNHSLQEPFSPSTTKHVCLKSCH